MTVLSGLRERLRPKPFRSYPLWRQALAVALIALAGLAAGAGAWAGYLRATGNIHEVEPGRVYRSGQLWPSQLASLIHDKGIRTVINLRGENPGRDWYDDEVRVTTAAGVRHISLPLSANAEPSEALLDRLITTLGTAEQPMLIHCEAGADRSGLASALYKLINKGEDPVEADRQLSFRYGHFPWLMSRTGAMDRTFWRVAASRQPGRSLESKP